MPRLFNISSQHVTPLKMVRRTKDGEPIFRYVGLSVAPGDGHDFTDEEVERLGDGWVDTDPRAGLPDELAFRAKRDRKTETQDTSAAADTSGDSESPSDKPAESGEESAK